MCIAKLYVIWNNAVAFPRTDRPCGCARVSWISDTLSKLIASRETDRSWRTIRNHCLVSKYRNATKRALSCLLIHSDLDTARGSRVVRVSYISLYIPVCTALHWISVASWSDKLLPQQASDIRVEIFFFSYFSSQFLISHLSLSLFI